MRLLSKLLAGLTLLLLPALLLPAPGLGAGFSRKTDQADRAVPGRRPQRHHRARDRPAHVRDCQAAGADRQPRRPGRRARHRRGRKGRPRRLHHRDLERGRARHQPEHGKGRLRYAEGFRAGDAGRHRARDAGGRDQRPRQGHEGTDRARQGAAGKTEFRLVRSRQPAASGGRTAQADGQHRHRARALPRRRAGGERPARPAGADDVPRSAGAVAAGQGRRPAADRDRRARAGADRDGGADHGRSRNARHDHRELVRHGGARRHAAGDRRSACTRSRPKRWPIRP